MPAPGPAPHRTPRAIAAAAALVLSFPAVASAAGGASAGFSPWPLIALALAVAVAYAAGRLLRLRARLREMEEACAEHEAQARDSADLASLLRAVRHIAVIAADPSGVIRVFNTGAEHMLGYRAEELVGLATPEIFHLPEELERRGREVSRQLGRPVSGFTAVVTPVREGGPGGCDRREWTFVRKDGSRLPVDLTITGVYGADGAHTGFLGVAQDLSGSKALEAHLRQAQASVDNADDIILWGDMESGRLGYVNKAACKTLGYTRQELLAMTVLDLNPARTSENWRAHCQLLLEKGRTTAEMMFRRKDGGLIPVESTSTLVTHGGRRYSLGIARDVTRRKALEASLRQAEVGMDNVQDMILWVRVTDRSITYANRAACRGLGYLHQELIGLDAQQVNPLRSQENWREACANLRREGQHTFEAEYRRKDGSLFPVETSATMVVHEGQEYIVGIVRDITERKLAERALTAAKEAAESSSRAKSEFLANMTHEVRTPLNGVLGMLQVLQQSGLDADQRESADVAMEAAERLNRLIDNVIEFARLDSGRAGCDCMSFPPTDVLSGLKAAYEPLAREKGLEFRLSAGPNLPESIRSDPQALRLALMKLLDNAVKFTCAGHVALAAAVAQDNPAMLVFRVEDSGIGIPPEQREAVFEAFTQADSGFTRTYGGAGLGLAIARRLALAMGGALAVADRPGGGTVMLLTIPVDCGPPKAA